MKVTFKSTPKNYAWEETDVKNNTIRKVDLNDERFVELTECMHEQAYFQDTTITIINTETKESFTRRINNITFYEGYFIITWAPK